LPQNTVTQCEKAWLL